MFRLQKIVNSSLVQSSVFEGKGPSDREEEGEMWFARVERGQREKARKWKRERVAFVEEKRRRGDPLTMRPGSTRHKVATRSTSVSVSESKKRVTRAWRGSTRPRCRTVLPSRRDIREGQVSSVLDVRIGCTPCRSSRALHPYKLTLSLNLLRIDVLLRYQFLLSVS